MSNVAMSSDTSCAKSGWFDTKPPRRFRTAYNYFFMYERAIFLECQSGGLTSFARLQNYTELNTDDVKNMLPKKRRRHVKTKGMAGLQNTITQTGDKWRSLAPEERQVFDDLAKEDLERWQKENREYKEHQEKLKVGTDEQEDKLEPNPAISDSGLSSNTRGGGLSDQLPDIASSTPEDLHEQVPKHYPPFVPDQIVSALGPLPLMEQNSTDGRLVAAVSDIPMKSQVTQTRPILDKQVILLEDLSDEKSDDASLVPVGNDYSRSDSFDEASLAEDTATMGGTSNFDVTTMDGDSIWCGNSTLDGMTIAGRSTLASAFGDIESINMESFACENLGIEGSFATMSISAGDFALQEGQCTVVYENQTTRVVRIGDPDNKKFGGRTGAVAIKMLTDQFPDQARIACLDNEYKISQRLTKFNCDSTRSALHEIKNMDDGTHAIQLEWAHGVTLRKWIKSSLREKTELSQKKDFSHIVPAANLARKIAMSLAEIHACGVIHNKLTAENIIVDVNKDKINFSVKIIDFVLASVFEEGSNYSIQSDLESLGTVLYELFTSINPLTLVSTNGSDRHAASNEDCALNRELYSLLTPKVPPCISSLILNLMENRGNKYHYHSATDVVQDLYAMISQPDQFYVETDVKGGLKFSTDKLYGREQEMLVLTDAFDRVSQPKKVSEMVLIVGYSGAGKSALVQHFKRSVSTKNVNFLSGKFEKRQQTEPLSAITTAFRGMCDEIVTRDEDNLRKTRAAITKKVGSEIGILANLIPSLRDIVGSPIAETAKARGMEALNQFKYVFRLFVRAVASPTQPLVLFLDDLQWADAASLELITSLITDAENSSLLLLGSYRENEVDDSHPLTAKLQEIQSKAVPITKINVRNICKEHVNELISDTLQTPSHSTHTLSDVVYRKTSGNILFVVQFLKSLCDEGLLRFLYDTKQWQWNTDLIESKDISDDAVGLMSRMLLRIPEEAQTAVKLVACLGVLSKNLINCLMANTALCILGRESRHSYGNLVEWLDFAVSEGLMDHEGSKYKFSHDQIQQAAYSLISEHEKGVWHLQIGTQIWANKAKSSESVLYIAVGQFNQGKSYITSKDQRLGLAQLNLQAGEKAMSSAVFTLAASFLKSGIELLDKECWEEDYSVCLKIFVSYAEVSYCNGDFDTMDRLLSEIFVNAKCYGDKHPAYFTLIRALGAQAKLHESIETALFVLDILGEPFPTSPDEEAIAAEFSKVKQMLEGKADNEILGLPAMEDNQKIAAMQLLSFLVVYAVLARVRYLPLFSFRMVQLSLRYGVCNESAIAFASFGFVLCGSFNDINGAYQHGQLALRLVEKLQAEECIARTHVMVYGCTHSWVQHHRLTLEPLQNAYTTGMRCGDIQYALFCAHQYYIHAFQCGEELSTLEKIIKKYAAQMLENKQNLFWKYAQVYRQTVLNWMGCSNDPLKLTGEVMNQDQLLKDALENKHMALAFVIYHNVSWLAYGFGNYELAAEMAEVGQNILDQGCSFTFLVCNHAFVFGLVSFVLARKTGQIKWRKLAHECTEKMERWSQYAPSNCLHKLLLMQAESAILLGEKKTASTKYDAALKQAEESGFVQELALIHERVALFHMEEGNSTTASHHYGQSHDVYLHWGAKGKAEDLCTNYPF